MNKAEFYDLMECLGVQASIWIDSTHRYLVEDWLVRSHGAHIPRALISRDREGILRELASFIPEWRRDIEHEYQQKVLGLEKLQNKIKEDI